jgi:uncharacterized protein YciI
MPQFVVTAFDYTDADALERRMKVRQAHIDLISEMRAQGKIICGLAMLDSSEKMIGSTVICNMESRAEVDAWLAAEPYITGKVWEKVDVKPAKLGPSFADLIKA